MSDVSVATWLKPDVMGTAVSISSSRSGYGPRVATPLHVYLNDHRSGAMTGMALSRKLRSRFGGTDRGPFFTQLAGDIEADADTLTAIMAGLQVRRNAIKHAGGWAAEKVSRL